MIQKCNKQKIEREMRMISLKGGEIDLMIEKRETRLGENQEVDQMREIGTNKIEEAETTITEGEMIIVIGTITTIEIGEEEIGKMI